MPSCDGAMSMSDIHEEERRQERTIETLRKENEELKNQLEKLKSDLRREKERRKREKAKNASRK